MGKKDVVTEQLRFKAMVVRRLLAWIACPVARHAGPMGEEERWGFGEVGDHPPARAKASLLRLQPGGFCNYWEAI